MVKKAMFVALVLSALNGCAISQRVAPVEPFEGQLVCIVENRAVKQGFLEAYKRVLSEKGYAVRQVPSGSAITDCPITSTYTANWRWDLALYLAYADIKVFKDGRQSGHAVYNSLGGSFNLGKFVQGDTKVAELVNELFPVASRTIVAKTFTPTPASPSPARPIAEPVQLGASLAAAQADVAANPTRVDSWVNLGVAYRERKQYAESERALSEATRRDAKSKQAWLELGRTLKESGQDSRIGQIHSNLLSIDTKLADEFFHELVLPK